MRVGDGVWLWQDEDGWVAATVTRVESDDDDDDAEKGELADPCVTLCTGRRAYGGSNVEVVRLRGEDTVVPRRRAAAAPPVHFPASLLPPPTLLSAAERATAFPRGTRAAREAARAARSRPYGADFVAGASAAGGGGGGGVGLFAAADLPAGTFVTRYSGDVRGAGDFVHTQPYAGPRADELNRGTHAARVPGTGYVLDGWHIARAARMLLAVGEPLNGTAAGLAALANSSVGDAHGRPQNCTTVWAGGDMWLVTTRDVRAGDELLCAYQWG